MRRKHSIHVYSVLVDTQKGYSNYLDFRILPFAAILCFPLIKGLYARSSLH